MAWGQAPNPSPRLDKSVRMVYLVSQDRSLNPAYQEAIARAALSIQAWYKKQMQGATFRLNQPIVEVVYSDKKAAYIAIQTEKTKTIGVIGMLLRNVSVCWGPGILMRDTFGSFIPMDQEIKGAAEVGSV
ncbi:MAG: hypothetical protein OHK0053_23520 [Microscillaceae bacterium]